MRKVHVVLAAPASGGRISVLVASAAQAPNGTPDWSTHRLREYCYADQKDPRFLNLCARVYKLAYGIGYRGRAHTVLVGSGIGWAMEREYCWNCGVDRYRLRVFLEDTQRLCNARMHGRALEQLLIPCPSKVNGRQINAWGLLCQPSVPAIAAPVSETATLAVDPSDSISGLTPSSGVGGVPNKT